jgi:hypothetical protein
MIAQPKKSRESSISRRFSLTPGTKRGARTLNKRSTAMNTSIHFEGFVVVATNRVYSFSVTDHSDEARAFSVKIQAELFSSASGRLKFQDGPAICVHRILKEMDPEKPNHSPASNLTITKQDIEDYLNVQFPKKTVRRRFIPSATNPPTEPAGLHR